MNQADAMRRLEALEAEARQASLGPLLEELAVKTGIAATEIWAEAERVAHVTEGMSWPVALAWLAADAGMTTAELSAEAERLLGE